MSPRIYLDHHATTPVDARVIAAMNEMMLHSFANPGSTSHEAGREAAQKVDGAINRIAQAIDGTADELLFTSGATESINLATFGVCLHPRQKRKQIISVTTEHRAMLDPLERLEKLGWEVIRLPVIPNGHQHAGMIDLNLLEDRLSDRCAMVSVMLANNEIGVIQPLQEIAKLAHRYGALVHTDATQAVGKLPTSVRELDVDLLSFSGHKLYGPRGVGVLYVRGGSNPVRLYPQIVGGGQQRNLRSGTLNAPGIVGLSVALEICSETMTEEYQRTGQLRDRLFQGLQARIENLSLNGPGLNGPGLNGPGLHDRGIRLAGNLNCSFPGVEGESLMMAIPQLCVSSGSACTSADPHPSHVLLGLGLSEESTRSSLRFGIGRWTTEQEIDLAIQLIHQAFQSLQKFR